MMSLPNGYCTSSQLAEALADEMFNAGCVREVKKSEVINKWMVICLDMIFRTMEGGGHAQLDKNMIG
jgi:hypothetical protein